MPCLLGVSLSHSQIKALETDGLLIDGEPERKIGPNAGRPRWRDVDATGSHLRAILHAARAQRDGFFLEEDIESWVSPGELHAVLSKTLQADHVRLRHAPPSAPGCGES